MVDTPCPQLTFFTMWLVWAGSSPFRRVILPRTFAVSTCRRQQSKSAIHLSTHPPIHPAILPYTTHRFNRRRAGSRTQRPTKEVLKDLTPFLLPLHLPMGQDRAEISKQLPCLPLVPPIPNHPPTPVSHLQIWGRGLQGPDTEVELGLWRRNQIVRGKDSEAGNGEHGWPLPPFMALSPSLLSLRPQTPFKLTTRLCWGTTFSW